MPGNEEVMKGSEMAQSWEDALLETRPAVMSESASIGDYLVSQRVSASSAQNHGHINGGSLKSGQQTRVPAAVVETSASASTATVNATATSMPTPTPIVTTSLSNRLSILRNTSLSLSPPLISKISSGNGNGTVETESTPPMSPTSPTFNPGRNLLKRISSFTLNDAPQLSNSDQNSSNSSADSLKNGNTNSSGNKISKFLKNANFLWNPSDEREIYNTINRNLMINKDNNSFSVNNNAITNNYSQKKIKRLFKIDYDKNILIWNNKSSSFLKIDKIKSIRIGDDAKNYREEFKVSSNYKDLWITIIYYNDSISNNIKALHCLATTTYDYEIFLNTLNTLVLINRDLARSLSLVSNNELFANYHWNNYVNSQKQISSMRTNTNTKNGGDKLTYDGILKLTKVLNINVDKAYLLDLFKECDSEDKGSLNFDEFKKFVKRLRARSEILKIFKTSTSGELMNFDQFKTFLLDIQQEKYTDEFIVKLSNKFSSTTVEDAKYLTLDDFQNFLISSYTSPLKEIEEDYTRPLNEYFISSSHNTYLLGKQFGGESSVEGYIRALQRGCRCIEIDIWDGLNTLNVKVPVVKHGRSFSSSIDLKQVIATIRKYAFISTPFPLIISLEVHCSIENQLVIKNLFCDILGDMLVLQPMIADSQVLPSPLELKHKIIIKVKRSDSSINGMKVSENSGVATSTSMTSTTSTPSSFSEDSVLNHMKKRNFINRGMTTKISPELGVLGVYVSSLKFRNFSLPESKTYNHCFSFSEKTLRKMLRDDVKTQSIIKHNKKFLMRVYPSKYRYTSTNFNPLNFWELGIQMVATNWQKYDLGQQLSESMFSIGSRSGYILKPLSMRTLNHKHDIQSAISDKKPKLINFQIEILSAQQLPRPKDFKDDNDKISPFVEFEIYYVDNLKDKNYFENNFSSCNRTKTVRSNGFNPVWMNEFKGSFTTTCSDLVFLRFLIKCNKPNSSEIGEAHDVSDDGANTGGNDNLTIGVCCYKLKHMKKGFRHLPISDLQGEEYIFSTLFVKIDYGEKDL
ncbi:hypothetical protein PACTADRAFT_75090 [Pachysolen tannophilus NRRL Y-2460]|uniref:Phosphoinositide phospholipase C n=1 Tax=Pachysolen tannophilus NRRL Y-2460 TaxID=669874 RepID=A0A1E4TW40_PACTA|nr:hypothetical protein PACTADRAFT_75090 [Pachysolen tannophilus NRRL Y-2460]